MDHVDAIAWFQELADRRIPVGTRSMGYVFMQAEPVHQWIAEACSALDSVFPPNHALARRWATALPRPPDVRESEYTALRAVILAGLKLLTDGRLGGLIEGIRAETVDELLDQASELAANGYLVPAAVVAGGALETYLHFLCEKHQRSFQGHGSIEKYNAALGTDPEVLEKGDRKQVTSWGDMRNKAAHTPADFKRTLPEVQGMVEGIRLFVRRVARG